MSACRECGGLDNCEIYCVFELVRIQGAEIDSLKSLLATERDAAGKREESLIQSVFVRQAERDAWKKREAELAAETNARAVFISRLQKSLGEMEDDRDLWKSKAERLAEALKEISGIEAASTEWDGYMVLRKARDTAKEALSEFEGKEK